jgi:hypothetical protein
MHSKLSRGAPHESPAAENISEQTLSPNQKSTSISRSELPAVNGQRRSSAVSVSRQQLYPSYKRMNSKTSLPPIDPPPSASPILDTDSDESFSLLREKLLNPGLERGAQKKLSPQKKSPKRVSLKKSHSTQVLSCSSSEQTQQQFIITSSSEKRLPTQALGQLSPQKKETTKDKKISSRVPPPAEGVSVRRLSMQRFSLAKIEVPTFEIDQWTVLPSTFNSALRMVLDS